VPGGAHREYSGKLEVRRLGYQLQAIVEMDRETAVASIVAAEGAAGMPLEARKAQAIVTRSYLAGAHNRHEGYDFCDTEHCQLLKEPPSSGSTASLATESTRGQVLTYRGDIVAALYSANCGGHTKSLAQSSWMGAAYTQPGYPYYSVVCPLRGHASGHGVGMCQMGAIEIAEHGYSARIIVGHFFPNTVVETLDHLTPKPTLPNLDRLANAPARKMITASADTGAHVAQ
jgi:peptidoglycan hydrolase-like amidase